MHRGQPVRAGNQITQLELQALPPTLPGAHICKGDAPLQSKSTDPSDGTQLRLTHTTSHLQSPRQLPQRHRTAQCHRVRQCVHVALNESTSDAVNCTVAERSPQVRWPCPCPRLERPSSSFTRQVRRALLFPADGQSALVLCLWVGRRRSGWIVNGSE